MAGLIVGRNLQVSQSTIRSLIVTIFQTNVVLAQHLHHYATQIGHYPIINIDPVTCLRIDTNWTEEEMFLQVLALLSNIRDEFGHFITKMNPDNVHILLNFESTSRETKKSDLTRAKYSMKQALSLFNPKIEIAYEIGRISKLASESVIALLNFPFH